MSKKGTRRAYLEDSFSSHSSGQTRSTIYSSKNDNSYLSDDRSASSLSQKPSSSSDGSDVDDSFIVNDDNTSTDDTFHSASDSSIKIINSPMPPPRKQPLRHIKLDVNPPKTNPVIHSTPISVRKTLTEPSSTARRKRTVLEKTCSDDPEMQAMFLELYPELAEQYVEDEEEEELEQPVFDTSDEEEPQDTNTETGCSVTRVSAESNDSFERYLKVLKGGRDVNENEETDEAPSINDDDFVVSDTESIYISSDQEDDEEEPEISDEEDYEQENIPIINKPKAKVVDSLLSSFSSPSLKAKKVNLDDLFLLSLSADFTGTRHPDAIRFVKNGIKTKKLREDLTDIVFGIYKRRCFDGLITMERENVVWTGRLRTTAGQCRNNIKLGTSTIELSTKVCTTPERLRDTLVHEMCHAATWLIDSQVKAGHGPWWKKWTRKCMERCPSLPPIGVCHAYQIEKKFIYECEGCGQKIGRHSKSFNTEKKICGICRGRFILTRNGRPVTEESQPKINKFAEFVKKHYGTYKKNGVKHNEVMSILSLKWKDESTKSSQKDFEASKELDFDISILSIHD